MHSASDPQGTRVEIAVAVVEDDGRFLIARRPLGSPLAGYWEFPGGKILSAETPEQAAVRECLEETGLLVRVVGRYLEVVHDYESAPLRLHFFDCRVVEQRRPLERRFRWARAAELAAYSFPAANARLIELLTGSALNSTRR
jgi:8-oxo-dGTP diphosphatase